MPFFYLALGVLTLGSFGANVFVFLLPGQEEIRSVAPLAEEFEEPKAPLTAVRHEVPFTPQAPFAEWADPRQQYGCEESLSLMAMRWARGEELTLEQARQEILAISDWQEQLYGVFEDTSVQDTAERILRGYYGYEAVEVREGIMVEDIKEEMYKGNVVFVPVNGRLIGNPHYTPPGPVRHMIMVTGYDPAARVFTTNDPGTRHGEDFPYAEDVLAASLQNYETGFNEPIVQEPPDMLVVKKLPL